MSKLSYKGRLPQSGVSLEQRLNEALRSCELFRGSQDWPMFDLV